MTFEERLNELIDEVEVPDELSPENIALMLKAKTTQSKMEAEHINIKSAPSVSAQRLRIIRMTAASVAACVVIGSGLIAYNNQNESNIGTIDDTIEYNAISPNDYNDLYSIYTGIYFSADPEQTDNTEEVAPEADNTNDNVPAISDAPTEPKDTLSELSAYDFQGAAKGLANDADIVKSDGTNLYCISGGKLYIVSLDTMEIVSVIENKLSPPVELYIDGDRLILVSKENEEIQIVDGSSASSEITTSDSVVPAAGSDTLSNDETDADPNRTESVSRTNVAVDIYDLKDKSNPKLTTSYKQNGKYTSSKLVDGVLYLVSDHSDYRTAPLGEGASLDSFVPAYSLNGERYFVAPEDIMVPANANSTNYTVVSAIGCSSDSPEVTVKAVLGTSKNVYCSADTLYTVGVGRSSSGVDYSIITSFDLSKGTGITYKASSSVAGKVISKYSMNEYNGNFRIATEISDENGTSTSVYVLDSSLTVVNSAGGLLEGQKVSAVRFEDSFASLFTDEDTPALVLDLANVPPVQSQSLANSSAYLYGYSDNKLCGIDKKADGNGLTLTMYDADSGLMLHSIDLAEDLGDVCSKALTDRRAVLIDSGMIGIPVYSYSEFGVNNLYYVFAYDDEAGFALKGKIEYVELDDSAVFERAAVNEDMLYIFSEKKVVSVRLSDFKVAGSADLDDIKASVEETEPKE
ncbi:MAG: beta-propeller domain-containing protein [Oscillospiraceae bacterium]